MGKIKSKLIDEINAKNNPPREWPLTSDCCGAESSNTDVDICPDCLEHCEFSDGADD